MFVILFSFKKPQKEKMLTKDYFKKFYDDQSSDTISLHRGMDEDPPSTKGSKQGSLLSRLSNKPKYNNPDHVSLLGEEVHDYA